MSTQPGEAVNESVGPVSSLPGLVRAKGQGHQGGADSTVKSTENLQKRSFSYLPQLDGLRGLAVLGVALFHARSQWVPGGFIGVDVFFVLSGYLITTISLAELHSRGSLSIVNFYFRRVLRLLPALLTVCIVFLLILMAFPELRQRGLTYEGLLGAVTYSSTWMVSLNLADLGAMLPCWSLAVEEHFYLIWPVALLLVFRAGQKCKAIILVLTATAIVYRWAATYIYNWEVARIHYAPDTRAEQLMIGCALAVILHNSPLRIKTIWACIAAGLLFIFIFLLPLFPSDIYHAGGSTGIALLSAVVIAHMVTAPKALLPRLLSFKWMVWLGQRSYGVYLWNLPLITLMAGIGSGFLQVLVKFTLCLIVPALSFAYIEKPFLRVKERIVVPRKRKT